MQAKRAREDDRNLLITGQPSMKMDTILIRVFPNRTTNTGIAEISSRDKDSKEVFYIGFRVLKKANEGETAAVHVKKKADKREVQLWLSNFANTVKHLAIERYEIAGRYYCACELHEIDHHGIFFTKSSKPETMRDRYQAHLTPQCGSLRSMPSDTFHPLVSPRDRRVRWLKFTYPDCS